MDYQGHINLQKEKLYFPLCERRDRDGSCWLAAIGSFMYAKSMGYVPIYGKWLSRYKTNPFFQPILSSSLHKDELKADDLQFIIRKPKDIKGYETLGLRQNMSLNCIHNKIDNITYFNKFYKSDFLKQIKSTAASRPDLFTEYCDTKSAICIHLRWEDVSAFSDYNGKEGFDYVANLINNNSFDKYTSKHKVKGPQQRPIDLNKLNNLVTKIRKKKPKHKIILASHPSIEKSSILSELDFEFSLFTSSSPMLALWRMMHSDVLVFGKSNFPLVSAYLHLGSEVYYSSWEVHAANGLGTQYDKTNNWYPFI